MISTPAMVYRSSNIDNTATRLKGKVQIKRIKRVRIELPKDDLIDPLCDKITEGVKYLTNMMSGSNKKSMKHMQRTPNRSFSAKK